MLAFTKPSRNLSGEVERTANQQLAFGSSLAMRGAKANLHKRKDPLGNLPLSFTPHIIDVTTPKAL